MIRRVAFLGALLSCSLTICSAYSETCLNALDSKFYNECLKASRDSVWHALASTLGDVLDEHQIAIYIVVLVAVLPHIVLAYDPAYERFSRRRYRDSKIIILNVLHIVNYSILFHVDLFEVFRQKRPCVCSQDGGAFSVDGSMYAMPSGGCMLGAILGAIIISAGPFFVSNSVSMFTGITLIVLKMFEQVVLGYHSVAQAFLGSLLGFLLVNYSFTVPQYMIFVDSVLQILLGPFILLVYPDPEETALTPDNLISRYLTGTGIALFVMIMVFRYYQTRRWSGINASFNHFLHKLEDTIGLRSTESRPGLRAEMLDDDDDVPRQLLHPPDRDDLGLAFTPAMSYVMLPAVRSGNPFVDTLFTISAYSLLGLFFFLSELVKIWEWEKAVDNGWQHATGRWHGVTSRGWNTGFEGHF